MKRTIKLLGFGLLTILLALLMMQPVGFAQQSKPEDDFGGDLPDVAESPAATGPPIRTEQTIPSIPPAQPGSTERLPDVLNLNLLRDGDFRNFRRPNIAAPEQASGAWGTGEYSRFGLWWASGNARVRFDAVPLRDEVLPPGHDTAVRIQNQSPAAAHVFGTTAQRVLLAETEGRYRISLWARATNLKSTGAVAVAVDHAWKVRPIALASGSYPWKFYTGVFDLKDVDTATKKYVDLRLLSLDTGTVEITGLTLQRAIEGEAERLHAVMVFDDASNIRELVAADRRMMLELIVTMFAGRCDLTIISGDQATPDNILRTLSVLPSKPNDSLFFYYSGHGGTERTRGHALTMSRGILYRSDLIKAIDNVPAQMKIVLSDCCAGEFELKAAPKIVPRVFHPDVVHGLFLRHRGMVDITASAPGQYAVGNQFGGVFPRTFIYWLQQSTDELDRSHLGVVTWTDFFEVVRTATNEEYQVMRELMLANMPANNPVRQTVERQLRQDPHAFTLEAKPAFRLRTPR